MRNNFSPVTAWQLHIAKNVRYWFKCIFQANKSFLIRLLPVKCPHIFTLTNIFILSFKYPRFNWNLPWKCWHTPGGFSSEKLFLAHVLILFSFSFLFFPCWFLFCGLHFYCLGNWLGCNDWYSQLKPQTEWRHVHRWGRPSFSAAYWDIGGYNAF